jgi:hypothetical protein
MERFKPHNKNNKSEERFNKISNYNSSWDWWDNSIVYLGGSWGSKYYPGSRWSVWERTPSFCDCTISTRYICNQHKI